MARAMYQEEFAGLVTASAGWRAGWPDEWGPQDGRFRGTQARRGGPQRDLWEYVYWIGPDLASVQDAVWALNHMDVAYEVRGDGRNSQFVVFTDYADPGRVDCDKGG